MLAADAAGAPFGGLLASPLSIAGQPIDPPGIAGPWSRLRARRKLQERGRNCSTRWGIGATRSDVVT
jgi:hypothetical protein